MSDTRCGFLAIIGAPNAGKSTLINALIGEKVSIVTRKAQTTRSTVRGVLTREEAQIVFVAPSERPNTADAHELYRKFGFGEPGERVMERPGAHLPQPGL